MKYSLLIYLLCFYSFKSFSQKIVQDRITPISGKRIIVTSLLPVFQMKVIQVAAMSETTQTDSIFTVVFYQMDPYSTITDKKMDTTKLLCTILLENGARITGNYISTTESMGYKIMAYTFQSTEFRELSKNDATAFSLANVQTVAEYSLTKRYKENIKKVCISILRKLGKP